MSAEKKGLPCWAGLFFCHLAVDVDCCCQSVAGFALFSLLALVNRLHIVPLWGAGMRIPFSRSQRPLKHPSTGDGKDKGEKGTSFWGENGEAVAFSLEMGYPGPVNGKVAKWQTVCPSL